MTAFQIILTGLFPSEGSALMSSVGLNTVGF